MLVHQRGKSQFFSLHGQSHGCHLISSIEEDETYLGRLYFMCAKQSTGTNVMYGEVKILVMLLNMSVIH
jgi:hypothetical protein